MGIGFLLSSLIYGLFYDMIGWRGLLMIGILPALLIIWIRLLVKEPEVWVEMSASKNCKAAKCAPRCSRSSNPKCWGIR